VSNTKKLGLWFLYAGGFGVVIALALATVATIHPLSPTVLMVLWPWSIVGMADPSTPSDKIFVGLFEFGGQFLAYGSIGALLGFALGGAKKARP
jgi:hypothetical protein